MKRPQKNVYVLEALSPDGGAIESWLGQEDANFMS